MDRWKSLNQNRSGHCMPRMVRGTTEIRKGQSDDRRRDGGLLELSRWIGGAS
jgi:hypothetical protein